MPDYTTTFSTALAPQQVTDAILDTRAWWAGDIDGETTAVGDEFRYRVPDVHDSTHQVTQVVAGERVVWANRAGGPLFTGVADEWADTSIVFDVRAAPGGGSELTFTHVGLGPELACFDSCASGWAYFTAALRTFMETGAHAQPIRPPA